MIIKSLIASVLIVVAFATVADDASPIKNIEIYSTEADRLSIQNLSSNSVSIDIYGYLFEIEPASALSYQCNGIEKIELQFQSIIHDFFEVQCNSRVVINESFGSLNKGYVK